MTAQPLTLILSGSALRLMERLLDPGAALYGRADYRPLLAPLDFRDASRFAGSGSASACWAPRRRLAAGARGCGRR